MFIILAGMLNVARVSMSSFAFSCGDSLPVGISDAGLFKRLYGGR